MVRPPIWPTTVTIQWLNSTDFLEPALSGHPSRQKSRLRLPHGSHGQSPRRCSAEHQHPTGLQPRTTAIFVGPAVSENRQLTSATTIRSGYGSAVPDRAVRDKTGDDRTMKISGFGTASPHRIGRSHGAIRCRRSRAGGREAPTHSKILPLLDGFVPWIGLFFHRHIVTYCATKCGVERALAVRPCRTERSGRLSGRKPCRSKNSSNLTVLGKMASVSCWGS